MIIVFKPLSVREALDKKREEGVFVCSKYWLSFEVPVKCTGSKHGGYPLTQWKSFDTLEKNEIKPKSELRRWFFKMSSLSHLKLIMQNLH